MNQALLKRIRSHVASRGQKPREPACDAEIVSAERDLGFPLPDFLKDCFQLIGNGGFGPAYGIIGIGDHAYQGDFGDLVATYRTYHLDWQTEGRTWPDGLVPFLDHGCNIYDCVHCLDSRHSIQTVDQGRLKQSIGTLDDHIDRWLAGIDAPFCRASEETIEFINPFTRQKESRTIRRLL